MDRTIMRTRVFFAACWAGGTALGLFVWGAGSLLCCGSSCYCLAGYGTGWAGLAFWSGPPLSWGIFVWEVGVVILPRSIGEQQ